MRTRLKAIPLLKMTVADPEFMQGAPSEAPLNVFVRGDDMVELQRLNEEIVARVKAVPGAVDVDSSLETGQPEMAARINRELAADLGFDVGTVAMQLRGMVEGIVPTRLREDDKEYDIRVRLAPGVPQRLRGDRADAALLADRRRGAGPRHRAAASRKSARPASTASSACARPRSASSWPTGRSAT